jgi:hypothetical protein
MSVVNSDERNVRFLDNINKNREEMDRLETESAIERLETRIRLSSEDSEDLGTLKRRVRSKGKRRKTLARFGEVSVHDSKYPTYYGYPAKQKALTSHW